MECIICLEKGDKKSFIQKPSLVALANLLERTRERAQFKDCSVLDFVERLESTTAEELFERKGNIMLSVIHLLQMLMNLILQENVLQNQSILGKALWLKEKKEGHHLLEKRLSMITNFLEQDQRLKNMTKLCA